MQIAAERPLKIKNARTPVGAFARSGLPIGDRSRLFYFPSAETMRQVISVAVFPSEIMAFKSFARCDAASAEDAALLRPVRRSISLIKSPNRTMRILVGPKAVR